MPAVEADMTVQNQEYQAEFAHNLIETLGLDGAIEVCAQNCWAGIQAAVMAERRRRAH